jgi:hypothetical protein
MGLLRNTMKETRDLTGVNKPNVSDHLSEMGRKESDTVLKELESQSGGLSAAEADARVKR